MPISEAQHASDTARFILDGYADPRIHDALFKALLRERDDMIVLRWTGADDNDPEGEWASVDTGDVWHPE